VAELKVALREQVAQIEKVSERVQSIPPRPRLVENR